MGFLDKFRKKKQEAIPQNEEMENKEEENRRYEDLLSNEEEKDEVSSDDRKESGASNVDFEDNEGYDDNPFAGMEQKIDTTPVKEQSRTGKRLKGGMVAGIAAALAVTMVGYTAYNFMKPKNPNPAIKTTALQDKNDTNGDLLKQQKDLPGSYSELAKYENLQKQRQREELIRSGKLNPAKERADQVRAQNNIKYGTQNPQVTPPTPPSRPSMPQHSAGGNGNGNGGGNGYNGQYGAPQGGRMQQPRQEVPMYNSPVGFNVTESGKVAGTASNSVFTALAGTSQATGKKYTLTTGTIIPVTLLTGITSDMSSAGVTAQVRQDVYDSLTGTHLLIPQGSKIVGSAGSASGRRMGASFNRIILPNGASIKLAGPQATDSEGYTGMRDKYDEKWGPTIKGAFLSGVFTGIADAIGDIDTKETSGGGLMRSAWGNVAEKISDRISDKADALDKKETPAVKIRPGFQFNVYLTADIAIYQYVPLTEEPR